MMLRKLIERYRYWKANRAAERMAARIAKEMPQLREQYMKQLREMEKK